jgi:hypothetical protein
MKTSAPTTTFLLWFVALGSILFGSGSASANTISIDQTINGTEGPWTYVNGGLNTSFQYGVDNQLAPVVVSGANGFDFTAGDTFTITYLSGTVSVGSGFPFTDANGDTAEPVNNGLGSSGKVFPSFYIPSASYPVNLGELVGTFANSSGAIVGTPFKIGDSASVVVPSGATQLQLGINDDIFDDNAGSYTVQITGVAAAVAVPEPTMFRFVALGLAAIIRLRRG